MKRNTQPVTKQDVIESQEEMAQITEKVIRYEVNELRKEMATKDNITRLEGDIAELKAGQKSLESGLKAVLTVVQSIDQQL